MIGLFDSGLGGLTVLRRIRARLPDADIVYLADQAHVPYGDRQPDDLYELLCRNLAWLDAQGVAAIAMACNTSCAIAQRYGWPATRAVAFDLIDSAATAAQRAGYRRIGVVATAATVAAGSYGRTLRSSIAGAEVWEIAAPTLVPLIEAGEAETPDARRAVEAACRTLPDGLDAVVYGCTHYPMLHAHFEAVLPGVALLDPAHFQAERVAAAIADRQIEPGSGRTRYVTSGDPSLLRRNLERIFGVRDPQVDGVDRAYKLPT